MAEKTGAGNKPQAYDPDNGQYGKSGKGKDERFRELERKYNDDLPIELSKKQYSPKLDSAVMNKYSTVKRQVDKFGYAIVRVFVGDRKYWVKINKSEVDFDYDILREKKND